MGNNQGERYKHHKKQAQKPQQMSGLFFRLLAVRLRAWQKSRCIARTCNKSNSPQYPRQLSAGSAFQHVPALSIVAQQVAYG